MAKEAKNNLNLFSEEQLSQIIKEQNIVCRSSDKAAMIKCIMIKYRLNPSAFAKYGIDKAKKKIYKGNKSNIPRKPQIGRKGIKIAARKKSQQSSGITIASAVAKAKQKKQKQKAKEEQKKMDYKKEKAKMKKGYFRR